MPQAERQLPLIELAHYPVWTEVPLQLTAPSLCVGNYICLMKSEVACSPAGDISHPASQQKQSAQDYANGSAWLGGVSPFLALSLLTKTLHILLPFNTYSEWIRGRKAFSESLSTRSGLHLTTGRKEPFLIGHSVWNLETFTCFFITWRHLNGCLITC